MKGACQVKDWEGSFSDKLLTVYNSRLLSYNIITTQFVQLVHGGE